MVSSLAKLPGNVNCMEDGFLEGHSKLLNMCGITFLKRNGKRKGRHGTYENGKILLENYSHQNHIWWLTSICSGVMAVELK